MSISNYAENKLLDAVFNHSTTGGGLPTTDVYIKLHTGDPGEDCTANAAGETTRKQASFAAAASGATTTDTDTSWTNVSTAETYSHVSVWDASSGGNPLWSGPLNTPKTVAIGDTFTILAGDLDVTLD